ncbi:hypothetical protein [Pseudoxanthomonas suwonensis]|uniref:Secreted protein n=1 Tax=Pseudoxanthomonas suwonensis TaxID=314722 RepID=A0A0E3Z274_9GAMM|nr:hypothetical protein [Pseudoxanthomonas suwonensis]AKC87129.1 hypothetical protein WQ53_10610 [Pseudoxanthomonas suwonensis]
MPFLSRPAQLPLRIVLATVLALLSAGAASQPEDVSPVPAVAAGYATGDAWIDGRLADIDAYAERHPEAFAAELERYAGVPRAYVAGLLEQPGWRAGDVWFACFLARATEATCRSVVRGRSQAGAAAGWRPVAEDFGAAPGSKAYADLRLALADSYRRWARPLQPDPALTRALRQRDADSTP